MEVELKKEIKKLQRLRDQIKTWLQSNEIKDKRALTESRKNIETEMERFKICEREMKTKQYSKEGLQAKEKLDPAEVARNEAGQWITSIVDKLNTQVDVLEAESEQIGAQKRKSKSDQSRLKEIENHLERHKFHMAQLEIMLRMLENDQLSVEDIETVKGDIEYYTESNQEPDFEEDTELYEHLNLIDDEAIGYLDEHQGSQESVDEDAPAQKTESAAAAPASKKKSKEEPEPAAPSKKPAKQTAAASSTTKSKPTSILSKPSALPSVPAEPVQKLPPPMPTVKYSAAASAGLKEKPAAPVKTLGLPPPAPSTPVAPVATSSTESMTQAAAPPTEKPDISFSSVVQQPVAAKPGQQPLVTPAVAATAASSLPSRPMSASYSPSSNTTQQQSDDSKLPLYFSDLTTSYESCQRKTYGRGDETLRNQFLMMLLESSYHQCPDVIDAERPSQTTSTYTPANPSTSTPAYYPKQPLLNLSLPAVIERFDIDTLFFLFYYRQNTREQMLAARELKRQSWRFHKKYLTWFQRHEEPKTITDEYEQGTYIYFDYEGAWCQRKKTEFTFEYRYLEGE